MIPCHVPPDFAGRGQVVCPAVVVIRALRDFFPALRLLRGILHMVPLDLPTSSNGDRETRVHLFFSEIEIGIPLHLPGRCCNAWAHEPTRACG
jgi:hypothetical protein